MNIYQFDNELSVSEDYIIKAAKSAIKAICDELPEEAHRVDVITHVLNFCKEDLQRIKVKL